LRSFLLIFSAISLKKNVTNDCWSYSSVNDFLQNGTPQWMQGTDVTMWLSSEWRRCIRGIDTNTMNSDDRDSMLLWNVGQYLPHFIVLHFRRQPNSMCCHKNIKSHEANKSFVMQ
jgi:hypothetical protein